LYLLALLNSELGHFYFKSVCAGLEGKREIYLRFFGQYLEGFPVAVLDLNDRKQKATHSEITALAKQMGEVTGQLQVAVTDKKKSYYANKLESIDRRINSCVYDIYGLSEDEIEVVWKALQDSDSVEAMQPATDASE